MAQADATAELARARRRTGRRGARRRFGHGPRQDRSRRLRATRRAGEPLRAVREPVSGDAVGLRLCADDVGHGLGGDPHCRAVRRSRARRCGCGAMPSRPTPSCSIRPDHRTAAASDGGDRHRCAGACDRSVDQSQRECRQRHVLPRGDPAGRRSSAARGQRAAAISTARAGLQWAATFAGIGIDNCGTAIAHNIGHALASLRPIHHGRAVGVALRATLPWSVQGERHRLRGRCGRHG